MRPYGVVRIDSAAVPGRLGQGPAGNQKKIAETFKQAAAIARDHGERLAAEGEICWGGMHSWRTMVDLLERVGEPETVGFQADMAHTLLYTLGENAPEDRILPKDYDWKDRAVLDEALKKLTAALRPWTIDFHVAQNDATVFGSGTHDHTGPPLPGDRPQRQARHPPPRRFLAPRRARQAHQEDPPHLLGRLHVPQCRHDRSRRPGTTSSRHDPCDRTVARRRIDGRGPKSEASVRLEFTTSGDA